MRTHSKSGLFLIELIISILFFSLCAVVCVNLFLNSHNIAKESEKRSGAVAAAQTAMEIYREGGLPLLVELTAAEMTTCAYYTGFDETGTFSVDGHYTAKFTESEQDELYTLSIELFDSDMLLYTLTSTFYQPYRND